MAKPSLIRDLVAFARHEKKWWMVPLLLILALVGGILVVASNPVFGPWLYPFF